MLSDRLKSYAREQWKQIKPTLGVLGTELDQNLPEQGEERTLLELAFATLPASDLASVPFAVWQAYARHALLLRRESAFCRDIPEDTFLHCVYYPRINSEDIVDCRGFFYQKLNRLVEGKSGTEAVLAVNRWCAAQMTYETTDDRSINPITAYRCGLGRCGEESTFAVTALRSVGIPARQIYVPWWSHCDDNHAWVEVYADGGWHFLGACEPEPILDKGWFVNASGRAMLVCSRTFFDYLGEGLQGERLTQQQGICFLYNQTARYAETAAVTITVQKPDGTPAVGAWVRFYVMNMARPSRIAALRTDENGQVCLEIGLGSCLIEAESDGCFAETRVETNEVQRLTLCPMLQLPAEASWNWDFFAPEAGQKNRHSLTPGQNRQKGEERKAASEQRISRLNGYWKPDYQTEDVQLNRVFRAAGGHAAALWDFYRQYGERARTILLSLASKDWRDADPAVLAAHLEAAADLEGQEDDRFVPYVLCPRIGFEWLTDWRGPIRSALTEQQKKQFSADPYALWTWICAHFRDGKLRWQPVLWLQPDAALRLGAADQKGRRLLFVAILRTLGVPSRLDPVDGRPQYADGDRFRTVEADGPVEPKALLSLRLPKGMICGQTWSLSRWQNGWQALELTSEDPAHLMLPLGVYRLITVNRLPNGNQLVHAEVFDLAEAEERTVTCRNGTPNQLLAHYPVKLPAAAAGLELQCYAEPGAEPTEHCLNELLEHADRLNRAAEQGLKLRLFTAKQTADEKLRAVRKAIPKAVLEEADFEDAALETLARSIYGEPGQWPLLLLTDGTTAYYGHTGYAVGSVPLTLQLAELKMKK